MKQCHYADRTSDPSTPEVRAEELEDSLDASFKPGAPFLAGELEARGYLQTGVWRNLERLWSLPDHGLSQDKTS